MLRYFTSLSVVQNVVGVLPDIILLQEPYLIKVLYIEIRKLYTEKMRNRQMFPLVICLPLLFGVWMSVPIDVKGASDIFPNIACKNKDDCASINGSYCQSGICECPESTPIFVNVSKDQLYCLPTLNLTEGNCSYSRQCNFNNSRCVDQLCTCKERFREQDGMCVPAEKSTLIPIVIGAVIGSLIILTLCIYLWIARRKD